jgi:hypothetical protein
MDDSYVVLSFSFCWVCFCIFWRLGWVWGDWARFSGCLRRRDLAIHTVTNNTQAHMHVGKYMLALLPSTITSVWRRHKVYAELLRHEEPSAKLTVTNYSTQCSPWRLHERILRLIPTLHVTWQRFGSGYFRAPSPKSVYPTCTLRSTANYPQTHSVKELALRTKPSSLEPRIVYWKRLTGVFKVVLQRCAANLKITTGCSSVGLELVMC